MSKSTETNEKYCPAGFVWCDGHVARQPDTWHSTNVWIDADGEVFPASAIVDETAGGEPQLELDVPSWTITLGDVDAEVQQMRALADGVKRTLVEFAERIDSTR